VRAAHVVRLLLRETIEGRRAEHAREVRPLRRRSELLRVALAREVLLRLRLVVESHVAQLAVQAALGGRRIGNRLGLWVVLGLGRRGLCVRDGLVVVGVLWVGCGVWVVHYLCVHVGWL